MKESAYEIESGVQEHHWWFVNRRRLFGGLIRHLKLPADAPILDIGTSTGTNLRLLQELGFTNVRGLDPSDDAIHFCREKGLGEVLKGDITSLPFPSASIRLVVCTDVLEHVADERRALSEIHRVLAPDGVALIAVPAFMALWGPQDDVAMHLRRYRLGQLRQLITNAQLGIIQSFYFNFMLFLPILFTRRLLRWTGKKIESENNINTPSLNWILNLVFRIDVAIAPWLHPPCGVSTLVLCRKGSNG